MEYTIIGAVASGSTLFGYLFSSWMRARRDSEPEILSKADLRDLGLQGSESTVARIFTQKKKKRLAIAEEMHSAAKSNVAADEENLSNLETQIQDIKKEINREAGKIKAQKTRMERDAHIQGAIKHRLQKLRNLQMKISQQGNIYEAHLSEERFWHGVQNGDKKSRTMNNLLHFDESLQAHKTKSDEMLKRLQNDIALSEETAEAMEAYIMAELDM